MARLDILMPLYNRADTVAEAWGSLAAQSQRDFRVVAVDDGSEDDTVRVLEEAADGDPRLHLVRAGHGGIVAALNRGLVEVSAPIVVRMDGDDRAHPLRFERLAGLLDDRTIGVAGSRVAAFPPQHVSANMARYLKWQNALLDPDAIRRERYVESTLAHGAAAFRTGVLLEAGGWSDANGPEDLDLWLRLHAAEVRFRKSPETLYAWRLRAGSETRASRCSPEAFHRCRRHHLVRELERRDIGAVRVLGVGQTLDRWARELRAAGLDVEGKRWTPGQPLGDPAGRFVLACFGVPKVRARAREVLRALGPEEERFLFVGS